MYLLFSLPFEFIVILHVVCRLCDEKNGKKIENYFFPCLVGSVYYIMAACNRSRENQNGQMDKNGLLHDHCTKLEFGMYPQSMPTEWTHARTLRPWQSVRLDL